ncbi:PKD domain-containing protein [Marinicella meishanensis]|uniref:PKD domain-containing protein n=1 Tax=Marinicella meishanensis TaxID=2873263 RepID=UPI001CC0F016|nr:PKD domain-containing protein [Marinicella sp. NBU2979]
MNRQKPTLWTWVLATAMSTALTTATNMAWAQTATYHLPPVDLVANKAQAPLVKGPVQYGINTLIDDIKITNGIATNGQWTDLGDGFSEWTIRLQADHATSLDFGFKDLYLPPTAELTVVGHQHKIIKGPYTSAVHQPHGHFWPGTVPGDSASITIKVDNRYKMYLSANLFNVPRGFYKFWEQPVNGIGNKSLECNIDVNCDEGNPWRTQINSVARYSFLDPIQGMSFCTGQLINNTAEDATPYFLTGNHCGFERANNQAQLDAIAASMNIWWNYQSATCRTPGSALSGTVISLEGFNDTQSGAAHVANDAASDFALVRLNEIPDAAYGTHYTGWDRRDIAPDFAFSVHHPLSHAKRIAIENNQLFITTPPNGGVTDSHITIDEWDEGTTEIGSSGSGLWTDEGLLIGTLHFGTVAETCDVPVTDSYGRLFFAWDFGSDAQSRLSDWLDPDNTGAETLAGYEGCLAPSVAISQVSGGEVGELINFSSQVSGGTGGYIYQWDLGADGIIDGTGTDFEVRFNQEFVGDIKLLVRDSSGCGRSTNQALVVAAPDIQLQNVVNIRENLDQVCGNNNSVIDPGERWSTVLLAQNVGARSATDAYLALGKQRFEDEALPSDAYGNTVDNCARTFIDITSTGTVLQWEPANDDFPADDDGSTLIQLTQSFDHYGQSISQLRASSNGYLSTSINANGGDWDNDCPLPDAPNQDDEGARIYPLHDDLKDSVFYHQYFDNCPRPADTGVDQPCEVFLWQGADLFNSAIVEDIDVQAILYPETSQWVFQYAGNNINGGGATVGIQNTTGSDGISAACDDGAAVNATVAYCVYNRDFQPAPSGSVFMVIENPVIGLGNMPVTQTQNRSLHFAVTEDAQCGSQIGIDLQAAVYDEGFNAGTSNIFSQTIGNNGQCSVVTSCGVGNSDSVASNDLRPRRGLWWNPDRGGNGFDWYTLDQSSLVYLFYTGEADGEPVWYLANDADAKHNQYFNNITRYQVPGGFGQGQLTFDTVGWSNTSFIDATNAIQVREINGRLSAEKLEFFQYGPDDTPNLHTGLFFTPDEGGWGQSVGTLGDARVVINYLYTDAGQPYWTIASGPNDSSPMDAYYFNTFCPSCPAVGAPGRIVGDISLSLNGQVDGTLNQYNVTDEGVNWSRSNLPLINLIPPEDD